MSAELRAELAAVEAECADLHDALEQAAATLNGILAAVRVRGQAKAWAAARTAVDGAIDYERLTRAVKLAGTVGCIVCGDEVSGGYLHGGGVRCIACEAVA